MTITAYPAEIETDEGGFHLVTFPDVPEAGTDGRTAEEAWAGALDSLACALEGYVKARLPLPRTSRAAKGQVMVHLTPLMTAKLALYQAMRGEGLTKTGLAARLGVSETVARRLLDLRHASRIEHVANALERLGKRLVVTVKDAA